MTQILRFSHLRGILGRAEFFRSRRPSRVEIFAGARDALLKEKRESPGLPDATDVGHGGHGGLAAVAAAAAMRAAALESSRPNGEVPINLFLDRIGRVNLDRFRSFVLRFTGFL